MATWRTLIGADEGIKDAYHHTLVIAQRQRIGQSSHDELLKALDELQLVAFETEEKQAAANLLAAHCCYSLALYEQAYALYCQLSERWPASPLAPEAIFWAAKSCLYIDKKETVQVLQRILLEKYPASSWAAEAYWQQFTLAQYVGCEHAAFKHLALLPKRFPGSPLQICAHLIIGHEAARKNHRGTRLHAAVTAFAQAEATWLRLTAQNKIKAQQSTFYQQLYWYAKLARGRALLALAEKSASPGSRQLLIENASELFQQVDTAPFKLPALYQLARAHAMLGDHTAATTTLNRLVDHCTTTHKAQDENLTLACRALGQLALTQGDCAQALELFLQAEAASKEIAVTPIQTLDLWLHQSICLRQLKDYTAALTLLSRIVNSPVVSSLRLKAMCLRADIYDEQGRTALAIKQLESIVRKGGAWKNYAAAELQKIRRERR